MCKKRGGASSESEVQRSISGFSNKTDTVSLIMPSSGGAADGDVNGDQPNMFEVLCENVHTSMLTYNTTLQQVCVSD